MCCSATVEVSATSEKVTRVLIMTAVTLANSKSITITLCIYKYFYTKKTHSQTLKNTNINCHGKKVQSHKTKRQKKKKGFYKTKRFSGKTVRFVCLKN